jgi:two-component system, NtrC family, response regulator AtoC
VTPQPTILVADDDAVARDLLAEVLAKEGYRVRTASGGEECLDIAASEPVDLAMLDLRMPDLDGLEVLRRLTARHPGIVALILTAFATIDTAIEAIRAGAYDYISKPFRMEEIRHTVRRTLEAQRLTRENQHYRAELSERYSVEHLVGQSPEMVGVYKAIARVTDLDTTVLVVGESGTGKELVARAIHYASPRAGRAFVVVDCAALPETLFESELFGHERGAFTGAVAARRGLLETAEGGTCLLDEVGELSPALQAKLLRALAERAIRRVGGNDVIPLDVRIVAATNRDLRKAVEEGRFREDLYYRLNVVTITVPPLRDRRQDIPLLAQHLLARFTRATGKPLRGFAKETVALLTSHPWPGNVRQLEHAIESAVALSASDIIVPDDLPPDVRGAPDEPLAPHRPRMTLEEMKHWYVQRIVEEADGNKARAAEILGIDRRTLYRILERQPTDEEPADR